jgi:ribosomal protein L19E
MWAIDACQSYDTAPHNVILTSQTLLKDHDNLKKDKKKELGDLQGKWDADKETNEQYITRIKAEAKESEDNLKEVIKGHEKTYVTCLRLLSPVSVVIQVIKY